MASSIQFQDGQYGRGKVIGKWGRERNVPSTCGHSLGSRANASCQFVPTWYRTGYGWSCGKHRNVLHKMDLPPPPVVDETTPFIPFECSICISGCCQKKDSVTTSCNHRFHTKCLDMWVNGGRYKSSCPMCRTILPRTITRNIRADYQVRWSHQQILERLANIESSISSMIGSRNTHL